MIEAERCFEKTHPRGSAMSDFGSGLAAALSLLIRPDPDLLEIVGLSLRMTLSAVAIAAAIGLPTGAALALFRFPGRHALIVLMNALMGLPPVVLGLILYLLLSRAGPLGVLGLLFTPGAMIAAQTCLIVPIIASLSHQVIEDLAREYDEQLRSLGATPGRSIGTLLWDGRFSLVTAILAGFGRAAGEVGSIMIVGGNIDHFTRTITTAIVLETSKGNFALCISLGAILMVLALGVNAAVVLLKTTAQRAQV
jgi:tungstate transport system permease protein